MKSIIKKVEIERSELVKNKKKVYLQQIKNHFKKQIKKQIRIQQKNMALSMMKLGLPVIGSREDQLKKAFQVFDKDDSGSISSDELAALMTYLEIEPTKEQLEDMIKQMDTTNDGSIEFSEFIKYMNDNEHKLKKGQQ